MTSNSRCEDSCNEAAKSDSDWSKNVNLAPWCDIYCEDADISEESQDRQAPVNQKPIPMIDIPPSGVKVMIPEKIESFCQQFYNPSLRIFSCETHDFCWLQNNECHERPSLKHQNWLPKHQTVFPDTLDTVIGEFDVTRDFVLKFDLTVLGDSGHPDFHDYRTVLSSSNWNFTFSPDSYNLKFHITNCFGEDESVGLGQKSELIDLLVMDYLIEGKFMIISLQENFKFLLFDGESDSWKVIHSWEDDFCDDNSRSELKIGNSNVKIRNIEHVSHVDQKTVEFYGLENGIEKWQCFDQADSESVKIADDLDELSRNFGISNKDVCTSACARRKMSYAQIQEKSCYCSDKINDEISSECSINVGSCGVGFAGPNCDAEIAGCDAVDIGDLDIGDILYVDCNGCSVSSTVWGSGNYTYDSNICTAAAHEGRSGVVGIMRIAEQSYFIGGSYNEISTFSWYESYPIMAYKFTCDDNFNRECFKTAWAKESNGLKYQDFDFIAWRNRFVENEWLEDDTNFGEIHSGFAEN